MQPHHSKKWNHMFECIQVNPVRSKHPSVLSEISGVKERRYADEGEWKPRFSFLSHSNYRSNFLSFALYSRSINLFDTPALSMST
mmetsp:Transcript_30622/g.74620  ORF Transcript_30622/g.74620 Transcript_30622/m.74620 type:complete len:85 (-) Transcript_30622:113-367(-)